MKSGPTKKSFPKFPTRKIQAKQDLDVRWTIIGRSVPYFSSKHRFVSRHRLIVGCRQGPTTPHSIADPLIHQINLSTSRFSTMASTIPVTPVNGDASSPQEYNLDGLKAHNTRESLWMLLHDKVYDITQFMDEVRLARTPNFSHTPGKFDHS